MFVFVLLQTELSHNLQQLSERAKSTTEFIQRLKGMSDKVNENCEEFEGIVAAQCDALIEALLRRRDQLIECIRQDKELRMRALKEQVATCTSRLQQTTALLQFCIEALKETDSTAFLQEVYCGVETICTVDGLHFRCLYHARVKAFNGSGEGDYSELIGLQTAEVAWFTFDQILSGPGLQYSEDSTTVTGEGWEHRVALGSVGFSRGVHYWEFSVDKFDADTDPAFGKDEKGWAMYIDRQRSWFQHAGAHEQRVEGGIQPGSTIGVLLDLNQHCLSYYVNDEPQGNVAFKNLYGVFYPAISINRGVSVTVHTTLDAPSDAEDT
ncbi:unnamed protein product [Brassicogethes aeneus]|uniref:Fibronectin type-III domain-containing protein n=1 Tax=Brassicogethes aeneus TaxID=1431903 RepID=A0A9P0FMA3_BRAAE|nr:unnamed protein product [Brassicogethes aeneus]